MEQEKQYKRKKFISKHLFLAAIIGIPLINFVLMYIMVKIDSILLAFQSYSNGEYYYVGFKNFVQIFNDIFVNHSIVLEFKNSALIYLLNLLVFPIHVFVAYLIWKKIPFSGVFKVILFLPSVVPSIIFNIAIKYMIELVFPIIFNNPEIATLLYNVDTGLATCMLYGIWHGLSGGLIIYLGTISGTDQSVVEYGKLDGLGMFGEFYHIILPHVYPTITAFLVAGITGLLTADCGLYSFFGDRAAESFWNMGYFIQVKTLMGSTQYGYLSCLGLYITIATIPVVFLVRYLLERFGPKET